MASSGSTEKHVKCSVCESQFRGQRKRPVSGLVFLQAISYMRGVNGKSFQHFNSSAILCTTCYLKANSYLKSVQNQPEMDKQGCDLNIEDTSSLPVRMNMNLKTVTEKELVVFTGLNKEQFTLLGTFCGTLRDSCVASVENRLGMLLMKLRHDLSNELLGALFGFQYQGSVSNALKSVRQTLMTHFVPSVLGSKNLSRSFLLSKVPAWAQKLYGVGDDKLVLVFDGTYIYTEKSNNYSLQRRLYSVQKGRPLVKPMMIVTPSGYIVDIVGPFVGVNNDASITNSMFADTANSLKQILQPGDCVLVDRGFRDSMTVLEEAELIAKMPCLMEKASKQHDCLHANQSRIVTKGRWCVEAKNGHLKMKYKMFRDRVPIAALPHLREYILIAGALENQFSLPLTTDSPERSEEISEILARSMLTNQLQNKLQASGDIDKRSAKIWKSCDESSITDFPRFAEEDLYKITLGIYQIHNAQAYAAEHVKSDGSFSLFHFHISPHILKFKIQSRHVQSLKYTLFIEYDPQKSGAEAILGWYCKCPSGARVLGCCSHVASVLWYLGFARYETFHFPASHLSGVFLDTNDIRTNEDPDMV